MRWLSLLLLLGVFFLMTFEFAEPNTTCSGPDCGCSETGAFVSPALAEIEPPSSNGLSPHGLYRLVVGESSLNVFRVADAALVFSRSFSIGNGPRWGFSPDDHRFVFHELLSGNNHQVYLYNLQADNPHTPVVSISRTTSSSAIGFSPNGHHLLYAAQTAGFQFSLSVWNARNGSLRYTTDFSSNSISSLSDDNKIAGWGFSDDCRDRSFVYGYVNDANIPVVTLVNLSEGREVLRTLNDSSAYWQFSKCGDAFGIIDQPTFNDVRARLYKTKDGVLMAERTLPLSGAPLLHTETNGHFFRVGTSDQLLAANTAAQACPAAALESLSLDPNPVTGGSPAMGRITLSNPFASPVTVQLAETSDPANAATLDPANAATLSTATVIIPANTLSATFSVQTTPVLSPAGAVIRATYSGVTKEAELVIEPDTAALQSLTLTPERTTGGRSVTGTVTLQNPAPSAGAVVQLSSNDANDSVTDINLPAQVTVLAGQASANFTVSTQTVAALKTITITAQRGTANDSRNLTLDPPVGPPELESFMISPSTTPGGNYVSFTVRLDRPIPSGGAPVNVTFTESHPDLTLITSGLTLSHSSGSSGAIYASSIMKSDTIYALPVAQETTVTLTATANGKSIPATLTIRPAALKSVTLDRSEVTSGGTRAGTFALDGIAKENPITVSLSSSHPTVAWIVVGGQKVSSVSWSQGGVTPPRFEVHTAGVTERTDVKISATYGDVTKEAPLGVLPPQIERLEVAPNPAMGGSTVTGRVTLTSPAPTNGVEVPLSTGQSQFITLPAFARVSAGQRQGTFTFRTVPTVECASAFLTGTYGGATKQAYLMIRPQLPQLYAVTDLGTLGGSESRAYGLNEQGQVVGSVKTAAGQTHAFVSDANASSLFDLGTLGGSESVARAINGQGQIVGESKLANGESHAFRSNGANTAMVDLGTLGGPISSARAINDAGVIAGMAEPTPDEGFTLPHAFRLGLNAPAMTDVNSFQAWTSEALGMSEDGRIVGWYDSFSNLGKSAFYTDTNGLNPVDLGEGEARDINGEGYVVGGQKGLDGNLRAFQTYIGLNWAPMDLGTLGGDRSVANAINDQEMLVGTARNAAGEDRACRGGCYPPLEDLNPLLSPNTSQGWTLTEATALNNKGQIAGYGTKDGQVRAFRLDPIAPVSLTVDKEIVGASDTIQVTLTLSRAPGRELKVPLYASGPVYADAATSEVTFGPEETTKTLAFNVWDTSDDAAITFSTVAADKVLTASVSYMGYYPTEITFAPGEVPGSKDAIATVRLNRPIPAGKPPVYLKVDPEGSWDGIVTGTTIGSVPVPEVNQTYSPALMISAGGQTASFTVRTASVQATRQAQFAVKKFIWVIVDNGSGKQAFVQSKPVTALGTLTVLSPTVETFALSSPSAIGGREDVDLHFTLDVPAPAGGALIELSSRNPDTVTVPATVPVAAGERTAKVTIRPSPVSVTTPVALIAALNPRRGQGTTAQTLTVLPVMVSTVVFTPERVTGGFVTSEGKVTLNTEAFPGGATVALESGSPAATVPATVTVPEGQKEATFTVTTAPMDAETPVMVTAGLNGGSATGTLTVLPPQLAFVSGPANSYAGSTMAPVRVAVQDIHGNTIPSANKTVTLALGENPGGSTLAGTLTAATVEGIATFDTLKLNRPGANYTLAATAANVLPVTSAPFHVLFDLRDPGLTATWSLETIYTGLPSVSDYAGMQVEGAYASDNTAYAAWLYGDTLNETRKRLQWAKRAPAEAWGLMAQSSHNVSTEVHKISLVVDGTDVPLLFHNGFGQWEHYMLYRKNLLGSPDGPDTDIFYGESSRFGVGTHVAADLNADGQASYVYGNGTLFLNGADLVTAPGSAWGGGGFGSVDYSTGAGGAANHIAYSMGAKAFYSNGVKGGHQELMPVLAWGNGSSVGIAADKVRPLGQGGRIHVAVNGHPNDGNTPGLTYLSSTNGTEWAKTVLDTSETRRASLALDADGNPWIAYYRNRDEIRVAHLVDGNWTNEILTTEFTTHPTNFRTHQHLHLVFDKLNRPTLFFYNGTEVVRAVPEFAVKAPQPTLLPKGGVYPEAQVVRVLSPDPSVTLRYTLNGETPTEADPEVKPGRYLYVDDAMIVKVRAFKPGLTPSLLPWVPSDVRTEEYHIVPPPPVNGLFATYYDNMDFTNPKVYRVDPNLDMNWGVGSPDPAIDGETFSARWVGYLQVPETGVYLFAAGVDYVVDIWVDGQKVTGNGVPEVRLPLEAGKRYPFRVDFQENWDRASLQVSWRREETTFLPIPSEWFTFHDVPVVGYTSGDTNGDDEVNVSDAIDILQMIVNLKETTPEILEIADVAPKGNPDGKIDIQDVVRLLRRAVGLEPDPWPH